jgi:arsenate reductase
MSKIKVLFLCTHNAARSQMAEAFLRHYGAERFEAYSAGLEPKEIDPFTFQVMAEKGYSLEGQSAKSVRQYLGNTHFGYIITVCDYAEENCPTSFLGVSKRIHWSLDDPTKFQGSPQEKLDKFRQVRDEVEQRLLTWLNEI